MLLLFWIRALQTRGRSFLKRVNNGESNKLVHALFHAVPTTPGCTLRLWIEFSWIVKRLLCYSARSVYQGSSISLCSSDARVRFALPREGGSRNGGPRRVKNTMYYKKYVVIMQWRRERINVDCCTRSRVMRSRWTEVVDCYWKYSDVRILSNSTQNKTHGNMKFSTGVLKYWRHTTQHNITVCLHQTLLQDLYVNHISVVYMSTLFIRQTARTRPFIPMTVCFPR